MLHILQVITHIVLKLKSHYYSKLFRLPVNKKKGHLHRAPISVKKNTDDKYSHFVFICDTYHSNSTPNIRFEPEIHHLHKHTIFIKALDPCTLILVCPKLRG